MDIVRKMFSIGALFALQSTNTFAADAPEILTTCMSSGAHSEQSECLDEKASVSSQDLSLVEHALRKAITVRDEDKQAIRTMQVSMDSDERQFKIYRASHCDFYASLAAGGNSAHDLRAACIWQANSDRMNEINWLISHWVERSRD